MAIISAIEIIQNIYLNSEDYICSEDSVGSLGKNSHFHPSGGSYKSQGVDSRRTVVHEVRRQNEITRSLRSLRMLVWKAVRSCRLKTWSHETRLDLDHGYVAYHAWDVEMSNVPEWWIL